MRIRLRIWCQIGQCRAGLYGGSTLFHGLDAIGSRDGSLSIRLLIAGGESVCLLKESQLQVDLLCRPRLQFVRPVDDRDELSRL